MIWKINIIRKYKICVKNICYLQKPSEVIEEVNGFLWWCEHPYSIQDCDILSDWVMQDSNLVSV